MLPLKTVLFATDFSKVSDDALGVAWGLARKYRAKLLALHACAHQVLFEYEARHRADALVDELWKRVTGAADYDPEIELECLATEGPPVAVILGTAGVEGCDLIVMGTHGRTGLRRAVLGSVAEGVARAAPCPVLTVGHDRTSPTPPEGVSGDEAVLPHGFSAEYGRL
jgi:nucleotide-binding universal stress UspA family protein